MNEMDPVAAVRQQIYDELHDNVTNKLTGIGMQCAAAARSKSLSPDRVRTLFHETASVIRNAIEDTIVIVSPESLGGYVEAVKTARSQPEAFIAHLKRDVDTVINVHGLDVRLFCSANTAALLTLSQKLMIQQLLGAWLDNIVQHAEASLVIVELCLDDERSPSTAILNVTENGKGIKDFNDIDSFCDQQPENHRGFHNIRNAAQRLGAEMKLITAENAGTALSITGIPLNRRLAPQQLG